jgi:hypothetical protein
VGKQVGRLIDRYIGRWGLGVGLSMFISNDL